jgi:His-Xaa-Ser system protein HxsD
MNSSFEINNKQALIKINAQLYSKEVIFQATYVLLDDFYFFLDLNEGYFEISMKPKEKTLNKEEFEKEILNFYDELIEAAAYLEQLKKTSGIREALLEGALFSQKKLDEENKKE